MSFKSLDELDLQDLVDSLADGGLRFVKSEKDLRKNIVDMMAFYDKTDPDQKTKGVPYQYAESHQKEWLDNWTPISQASSMIDKLIMDKYKTLFSLEIARNPEQEHSSQPPVSSGSPITNIYASSEKQKSGISWPSFGKKPSMPSVTPFKISLGEIGMKKRIKEEFSDYVDFHQTSVGLSKPMDYGEDLGLPKVLQFLGYSGLMNRLGVERDQFVIRAEKLITLISEGFEVVRESEKKYSIEAITGAVKMNQEKKQMF